MQLSIKRYKGLLYCIELAAVILFAVLASGEWTQVDPHLRITGSEVEWFTSSMTLAAEVFQQTGRLPWWQPYLSAGQPVIDDSMAFILNPFSSVPSLLLGTGVGLQLSIILHFVIAGVGGWFLAWSLGWGPVARLTLAFLLILKGNMQGSLGWGFFQLGIAQAYFPWIFAGALAIPRHVNKRWPQVLFALSFTLMFFIGNLYYTLPMALVAGLVAIVYGVRLRFKPFSISLEWPVWRRFLVAGIFTAGLMSVAAITILLNFALMDNHADHHIWNVIDLGQGISQFVSAGVLEEQARFGNSYTFVAPLWFVVIIFFLLPPIKFLNRYVRPDDWRLWAIAIIGLVWFALWGMGLNPIIVWMYENLPLISQWRFPERMLTVASFLFAVLVAFRLDGLFRALVLSLNYDRIKAGKLLRSAVAIVFALICGLAVYEVYQTRDSFGYRQTVDVYTERCVQWLREQYPERWLSVWRRDYVTITSFIQHRVRMANITVDYDLNGVPSNIYPYDLTRLWPEFRFASWFEAPDRLREDGYYPIESSPRVDDESTLPCVWRNPTAPGYAFSASISSIQAQNENFDPSITTAIETFERSREHIAMAAMPLSDEESVVVVQEIAYPGWIARVNGKEAKLESIGGLLGVILPPGTEPTLVEFIYTAPTLRLGGVITLLTAIVCVFYLLRVGKLPARKSGNTGDEKTTSSIALATIPAADMSSDLEPPVPFVPVDRSETKPNPTVIRTITSVRNLDQTPSPTLEIRVSSGRHRVVLPPNEEPLVIEVVVEKQRWPGINTVISLLFAGLIGANAMRWFSFKRRNKRD